MNVVDVFVILGGAAAIYLAYSSMNKRRHIMPPGVVYLGDLSNLQPTAAQQQAYDQAMIVRSYQSNNIHGPWG
jgi:hypothetical protein